MLYNLKGLSHSLLLPLHSPRNSRYVIQAQPFRYFFPKRMVEGWFTARPIRTSLRFMMLKEKISLILWLTKKLIFRLEPGCQLPSFLLCRKYLLWKETYIEKKASIMEMEKDPPKQYLKTYIQLGPNPNPSLDSSNAWAKCLSFWNLL